MREWRQGPEVRESGGPDVRTQDSHQPTARSASAFDVRTSGLPDSRTPKGVLFCGGGTGGHVLPGIAVAHELRARGEKSLRWIGDPERIEAKLVPAAGIALLPFGLSRPRLHSLRWVLDATRQLLHCVRELIRRPPRAIVALGGYASLIPGLLSPLMRRPLVVLEQNARPGRTNRLLARFADAIVTQFPGAAQSLPAERVKLLGNPVRTIAPKTRGREKFLRLLVMGGSLSAKSLNDVMLGAVTDLAALADLRIVHLAGEEDKARVAGIYASAGIDAEVHGFVTDMPALYDRIDVALTRSGATTVAELCSAGIPALYVPLPWAAEDHQTANAKAVERVGGAAVITQGPQAQAQVLSYLRTFLADRSVVENMGLRARSLARPRAAEMVAKLVEIVGVSQRDRQLHARSKARALARQGILRRDRMSA